MKNIFIGWLLFSFAIVLMIWMVKPELIHKAITDIEAPVVNMSSKRTEKMWDEEKDRLRKLWMADIKLPNHCKRPGSSMQALECKNLVEENERNFEKAWQSNVAKGWKPSGL